MSIDSIQGDNSLNQASATPELPAETAESEDEKKKFAEYTGLVKEFYDCSAIITISRGKLEQIQRSLDPHSKVKYSLENVNKNMAKGSEAIQAMTGAWERLTAAREALEEFIAKDAQRREEETTEPSTSVT